MARISREHFWKIIKPELTYFNKKWPGRTEAERKKNEREVLGMYFRELRHASVPALENAFRQHRLEETTFPKIPQVLRFVPKPTRIEEIQLPDKSEIAEGLHDKLEAEKVKRRKLPTDMVDDMKILLRKRWPGSDWVEPFNRLERENGIEPAR